MSEEQFSDDQSHYEVSLTAGQAFVAFVFLLLSLAAAFAFGLMIGRGQADERLSARKEPGLINEAAVAPKKVANTAEVSVMDDDFREPVAAPPAPKIVEEPAPAPVPQAKPDAPAVPHYAQLVSSSDQKAAEGVAARLIEAGFNSAYVERTTTDKGQIFRVRVKFASEQEARAAEPKLKEFSKEVWITKQ
jgi:cell division septation protein DedD